MKPVEIAEGVDAVGLALHLKDDDAIVLADLHLGYEEELRAHGVGVPYFQFKEIVNHLNKVLDCANPGRVIINGDLKHEFARISVQEWREVRKFIGILSEYDVTLVRGNHDTITGPITDEGNVRIVDDLYFEGQKIFVCHGHVIPDDDNFIKSRTILIAHEHPALGISDGDRYEKVKCYLKGTWQDKELIVQPSLNYVTIGTDILKERTLSPFLAQDLGPFKVYASIEDEILYFGTINKLREGI